MCNGNSNRCVVIIYLASSSLLLNGLAVAEMAIGEFTSAEQHLNEALTKTQTADTLANLVVVQTHLLRPPELINRTLSQLKLKSRNHPLITSLNAFDAAFDRVIGK